MAGGCVWRLKNLRKASGPGETGPASVRPFDERDLFVTSKSENILNPY